MGRGQGLRLRVARPWATKSQAMTQILELSWAGKALNLNKLLELCTRVTCGPYVIVSVGVVSIVNVVTVILAAVIVLAAIIVVVLMCLIVIGSEDLHALVLHIAMAWHQGGAFAWQGGDNLHMAKDGGGNHGLMLAVVVVSTTWL
ncbi:hypothetical protein EDB86DRAFT_2833244 [Lactarius hatsudake]|nr:hypothetical protein EDB86DRAFT_2833244 [Lactarius hatsudake]